MLDQDSVTKGIGILLLALSPVLGVVIAYWLQSLTRRFSGALKLSIWVNAAANSFACAFMVVACKLMVTEALSELVDDFSWRDTFAGSVPALLGNPTFLRLGYVLISFVGGVAAVWALVTKMHGWRSELIMMVMLFHTATEGAAVGTMIHSEAFPTLLVSLIVHNVPEGFVTGAPAYHDGKSLVTASLLAILSHLPQAALLTVALTTSATELLSSDATLFLQGVSAGSIAGTCLFELYPAVEVEIGRKLGLPFFVSVLAVLLQFS